MKLPSSRKGQGLPMNVIVIIVILLVVAVILILIFTSKSKTIAKAGDCADQGGQCKTSCDDDERQAFFKLIDEMKGYLDKQYNPAAYNIGINDGLAAGQTIAHLHIHIIPRYEGDIDDPRGGIRWIMPDKAKYW